MLVFQIIVTVMIGIWTISKLVQLCTLDFEEEYPGVAIAGNVIGLLIRYAVYFLILCFVWGWLGF